MNLIKDPPVARQPQKRPCGLFRKVARRDCFGRFSDLLEVSDLGRVKVGID